ncbi:MAG TPA: hypothetical protein VLI04_15120 [Nocardioidaceae bacterium]|nr:hypothetical protein [Nocardioidaceae bacterium]
MKLSYANVTSTLALALALGGTGAYAAATIGSADIKANAVKSTHIKNAQVKLADLAGGSVNSAKVANGSLLAADLKPGEIAKGQSEVVPSGVTLFGTYAAAGVLPVIADTAVSFGQKFAVAPTDHYIRKGVLPPAECPGNAAAPEALPGHLCVYEAVATSNTVGGVLFDPVTDLNGVASRFGFGVYAEAVMAGPSFYISGTWAATAP